MMMMIIFKWGNLAGKSNAKRQRILNIDNNSMRIQESIILYKNKLTQGANNLSQLNQICF